MTGTRFSVAEDLFKEICMIINLYISHCVKHLNNDHPSR